MDDTAEASLAEILARNRLGMAMAAMIRIMATTISNSIREKPFVGLERFMIVITRVERFVASAGRLRSSAILREQPHQPLVQSYGQSCPGGKHPLQTKNDPKLEVCARFVLKRQQTY